MAKNYPGNIEKLKTGYRVRFSVGGRRIYETLEGFTRKEAEDFARTKYNDLKGQVARGYTGPVPLSDLFDRFERDELPNKTANTQRTYKHSLKAFRKYFIEGRGGRPLRVRDVHSGHVEGFMAWRHRTPLRGTGEVSNRTIAKDRAVLHRVFRFAIKHKLIESNPVAGTDEPKGDSREKIILDKAQYDALLGAAGSKMIRTYMVMLGETGVRTQEALRLKWGDVHLKEGDIWIASRKGAYRTKSGKGRWVPMTDRLRDAMREHFALYRFAVYHGQQSEFVFHHPADRRRATAGKPFTTLLRGFKAAAKRAGLPPELVQHDLRHRRVTTWLTDGAPATLVKDAMGHSDLRTTMGYTHLVRKNVRALVQRPQPSIEVQNVPDDVPRPIATIQQT